MSNLYQRGLLGAIVAIIILIIIHITLYKRALKVNKSNRTVVFMDLIVTAEDGCYSLSRLQMYLWTIVVIIGFSAVFFATKQFPAIPEGVYLLMGINYLSPVISTGIYHYNSTTSPISKKNKPDFYLNIFFHNKSSLDLSRVQIFIWTIISIIIFIYLLVISFAKTPCLPDIPSGFLALMGISQGAYLGIKAVSK